VNLAMILEMAADAYPDRVAIGSRRSGAGLTYAALAERSKAAAAAARAEHPDAATLALIEPGGLHVPVTMFAAAWAGMSYAPLNYRLPGHAVTALVDRLERPIVISSQTTASGAARIATDEWMSAGAAKEDGYPDSPGCPAVLLFTSGTSSDPKAAVLEHDHLCAYVFNTSEFGAADEDEAVLVAVPPFHIAGVSAMLTACYLGRRVVPLAAFSAEDWLATARDEAVTHAFVVPTMLARIVAAAEADPDLALPSLRSLAYGGARMPAPVLERALQRFPGVGFVNAYGLTETSSTVCVLGPDDHTGAFSSTDPAIRRRLSSVGRPVEGIEVRIVAADGDAGEENPGEIWLRGAQISGAYVGQASNVDAEGWLHTGDLGWVDDGGYVFVGGRGDDVIIRGGENISPSEIEDTLLRHPSVAAAAAVGIPDEEWGERIGAMVVLRPGAGTNGEELFRWAREKLGSLKAPEVIVFRTELPTTATGKVLRRQIKVELAT
jgi:acyl-CoA synthetase (AMP-forming)/AMP-acid ligase II